ncbi:7-carboxy-7-deazaguanine synthase QueE [Streptomyces sp. NPDC048527]|uniref:7-carboxy-7-deazaguanine synthase QueE n=1 Tax=Streptomyces sp. NPDC048527 TaxID=3365568 RepID=UPI00371E62CE
MQGEGPSLGRRAGFVRLGGCNLHCSWCDTPYTWNAERYDLRAELTRTTVAEIVQRVLRGNPELVVITGGEPLLHQKQPGWARLLSELKAAGVEVEAETNGTLAPTPTTTAGVTRFNVSPKLTHAGDPEAARLRPAALQSLHGTGKAAFKFVCTTARDVAEVAEVTHRLGIPPAAVWVMPEGTTAGQVSTRLPVLAEAAIAAGFNLTTRLHVHVWGDERAR